MKRMLSVLVVAALMLVAVGAIAAGMSGMSEKSGKMAAARTKTVKGEIVDMGCYLAHAAKGADHKSCATKCLAGGMPFGVLTADGKLYLLTLNHDNPDPYNKCKDMAAETVEVTGALSPRNGIMAIDVADVKAAQ